MSYCNVWAEVVFVVFQKRRCLSMNGGKKKITL